MKYTPLSHQLEDVEALTEYDDAALLWADPGTGKTFTAIMGAKKLGAEKIVVLCPRIATSMWKQELEDNLGGWAYILKGTPKRKMGVNYFDANYLITTYDLAWKETNRDVIRVFLRGGYQHDPKQSKSLLIMDESHYLKSKDAKRTRGILGPECTGEGGVLSLFDEAWCLTGTPVTRHYDDLWSQLRPFRRDILKHYGVDTYDQFVQTFCYTRSVRYSPYGPLRTVVAGSKNEQRMRNMLRECGVVRRRLDEVDREMPDITHRTYTVDHKNKRELKVKIDPARLAQDLANPDSPMSQIRRLLGVAKTEDVADYIIENANMGPALIGFWHRDVMEELRELLERKTDKRIEVVIGGSSDKHVKMVQEDFNAGKIDFLLGQMRAMGVSWNLQEACNHVIIAEELVSPAELDQFIARVYRRGQKRHVQVDHLRSEHDLDAALPRLRAAKQTSIERADL